MSVGWKLNDVMLARAITNGELAAELGLTISAISRRRCRKIMPRLDGADLGALIGAIEKLSGESISIDDLIDVVKVIEVKR